MAYPGTTTYAGKVAYPYFSCAIAEINSLTNGSLTVKENIKGRQVIKTGAFTGSGMITDASCDFTSTAGLSLNERYIDPVQLQISTEICKLDYENDWEVEQMGESAWRTDPNGLVNWLMTQLLVEGLAELEGLIWHGDSSGTDPFDGFVTLMTADAGVIDVVGTTITTTNVIDEVTKVVDASTKEMKTQDDFEIVVAFNVFESLKAAYGGFLANGVGAQGIDNKGKMWYSGQDLYFDGYRVRVAHGLLDNYIVASYVSNLWFGTALMSDTTTVKIKDMEETDLSENVRFKAKFTAVVNYGCSADIVLYTPV